MSLLNKTLLTAIIVVLPIMALGCDTETASSVNSASVAIATPAPVPAATPECLIKGNTSFETGEKIYHMPGDPYYSATVIELEKGERMFCTEAEAQAAGWRKQRAVNYSGEYEDSYDYEYEDYGYEDYESEYDYEPPEYDYDYSYY